MTTTSISVTVQAGQLGIRPEGDPWAALEVLDGVIERGVLIVNGEYYSPDQLDADPREAHVSVGASKVTHRDIVALTQWGWRVSIVGEGGAYTAI